MWYLSEFVIQCSKHLFLENFVDKGETQGSRTGGLKMYLSIFRSAASFDNLAEYWRPAADTHRLAQPPQVELSLICADIVT